MWEYIKGIFLIIVTPLIMIAGARWNPSWTLNEDGDPNRMGFYFILIPYWILLAVYWRFREKSRVYAGDIGILTSPLFSEDEKDAIRKKYGPFDDSFDFGSWKGIGVLFKDNPGFLDEINKRNGVIIAEAEARLAYYNSDVFLGALKEKSFSELNAIAEEIYKIGQANSFPEEGRKIFSAILAELSKRKELREKYFLNRKIRDTQIEVDELEDELKEITTMRKELEKSIEEKSKVDR